jgi:hypothetical protein
MYAMLTFGKCHVVRIDAMLTFGKCHVVRIDAMLTFGKCHVVRIDAMLTLQNVSTSELPSKPEFNICCFITCNNDTGLSIAF